MMDERQFFIFLSSIPPNATEAQIIAPLEDFGLVTSIFAFRCGASTTNMAHVTFKSEAAMKAAVDAGSVMIKDHKVKISRMLFHSNSQHSSRRFTRRRHSRSHRKHSDSSDGSHSRVDYSHRYRDRREESSESYSRHSRYTSFER